MSPRRRESSVAIALATCGAMLAACGPNHPQANASANTRSTDSANIAAQAAEPRTGDPTAAQPPPARIAPNTAASVGGNTTAPAPAPRGTGTNAAADGEPVAQSKSAPAAGPAAGTPKRIGARHVLIQWMGSDRAGKSVLRTREQAMLLAQEVLRRAKGGEDLGRLANEYSDEPNAGARGGSLGRFTKGQMVGAFEQVAFNLEIGQISDIVETPFGFHIIQRTE